MDKVWIAAVAMLAIAPTQIAARNQEGETVDQHIEDGMKNSGVEVKPIVSLPNGDWLHGFDEELTPEQHEDLFGHRAKRSATHRLSIRAAAVRKYLWPGGIVPYKFRSFGRKTLVYKAMNEISKGTCIVFKPRKKEKNYISYANKDGCHSKLGMWPHGSQTLSLESTGCLYRDTVLHEILHALGLIHEQERPDRDQHIDVKWDNIKSGGSQAYDLTDAKYIKYYGVPYDFASIMHYSLWSWSKDRKNLFAMEPKHNKHAVNYVERKRNFGLSFDDYKILNRMYNCSSSCNTKCPEPGYITKDCECMTKPKFFELHCTGKEEAGWCVKYKLEGDVDDHIAPDPDVVEEEEEEEEEPIDPNCKDLFDSCKNFAKKGYCEKGHANYEFVKTRCERSCKFCS